MIIKDCEKYFKVAYNGNWQGVNKRSVDLWKENGANKIDKYLNDFGICIED